MLRLCGDAWKILLGFWLKKVGQGNYLRYYCKEILQFVSSVLTMSVPRSMQRMVTVPRGRGTLAMMKRRKGEISGMLLVNVYAMDFFKLSKMRRPAAMEKTRIDRYIFIY